MSLKRPISVIVFDRKSNDYGDLPAQFGWRHFCIYSLFKLGLDADGIPTDVWINLLATIFCARAGLKAAWVTFANVLRWLVTTLNPDPSGFLLWPDLQLILDVLKVAPDTLFSSKREYTWSLLQQLEGITQASGELFRAFRGFQAERDIIAPGQSAVISMPNMFPSWARQFFVDIILAQILYGRMHRSHRVDGTEVLIVIEEADPDISTEAEEMFQDRMCPVSDGFKKGREFGVSICVSISSPQSASRFVLSNATDQFMFRMTDADSAYEAARTLMLPPKGELRLNSLAQGQCLARQCGSWPHALVMKTDFVPPCRTQPVKYDTHPFVTAKRLPELPHLQQALAKKIAESRAMVLRPTPREAGHFTLGKMARLFLDRASLPENAFAPVHIVFRQIGDVAPATQLAVLRELERAGFMVFAPARIGKANVKLQEITPKGWEFLRKPVPAHDGRGAIKHRHYAQWIRKWAVQKQCEECGIEPRVPGTTHFGDVSFRRDGKLHIVQITDQCTSNITSHVRAALIESHGVDVLIFVTATKAQWGDIQARIMADPELVFCIDRIQFDVVETYMKEAWHS
jgi:hypothetical protein